MDFDESSHLRDTIISIIQIKQPFTIDDLKKEQEYDSLFDSIIWPKSYPHLRKQLEFLQSQPLPNYFKEYPPTLPFVPSLLKSVSKFTDASNKINQFISILILQSFVTWISEYTISNKKDGAEVLLECLTFARYVNHSSIYRNAFIDLYVIILKGDVSKKHNQLFPIVDTFFTNNYDLPSFAFDFLLVHFKKLFDGANETEYPSNAVHFGTLLTKLFYEKKEIFTLNVSKQYFDIIHKYFSVFDIPSLTFFTQLSQTLHADITMTALSTFPQLIIGYIESSDFRIKIPQVPEEEAKSITLAQNVMNTFEFYDDKSFQNGLDVDNPTLEIIKDPVDCLCEHKLLERFTLINCIVKNNTEFKLTFLGSFLAHLQKRTIDDASLTILAAFLAFCSIATEPGQLFGLSDIVVKYGVFNPLMTVTRCQEDFKQINVARQIAIELVFSETPAAFEKIFTYFASYPELFLEVLERSILVVPNVHDIRIIRAITSIALNYKSFNDPQYDNIRASLYRFYYILFGDNRTQEVAFNDDEFLTFFFSCLFEKSVSDFILKQISLFLMNSKGEITQVFYTAFESVFKTICIGFPAQDNVDLAKQIYLSLFKVFDTHPSFAQPFAFMIQLLCDFLTSFSTTEDRRSLFDFVFDCMIKMSQRTGEFNSKFLLILTNLILEKKIIELDDNLFNTIEDVFTDKVSVIKQPKILTFFMDLYWETKWKEIIQLLIKLVRANPENVYPLHSNEIDLYFVKKLPELNPEMVKNVIEFLTLVSSKVSSTSVVHAFINVIGTKRQISHLKFLNDMINFNKKIPITELPVDPSLKIPASYTVKAKEGFAFVCWINLQSTNPVILLKSHDLNIIIDDATIIINATKCFSNFRLNRWAMFTANFYHKECQVYINDKLVNTSSVKIKPSNTPVQYLLTEHENTCIVGNFGIFPHLTAEQVHSMCVKGPRLYDITEFKPYEFYGPAQLSDIVLEEKSNFGDILLKICKIDTILPLFAQLSTNLEENHLIIEIFKSCLLLDEEQQQYFYEMKGFPIISHLMLQSKFDCLNYEFYLKFCEICKDLTYKPLRDSLITSILTNFELWTKDIAEFAKITEHWVGTLYPTYQNDIAPFPKVSTILNLLRIYLWYNPVEFQHIRGKKEERDPTFVSKIRSNIKSIVVSAYQSLMTDNDFSLILSHAISCPDKSQVYDLVFLIGEFGKGITSFTKQAEFLGGVHYLLINDDEYIVTMALEFLAQLHQNKYILDFVLSEQIEVYFHQLKTKRFNESLVMKLVNLIPTSCPELFPICCYFARKIGEEALTTMLDLLAPRISEEAITASPTWALYSVAAALLSSEILRQRLYRFIIDSTTDQFYMLYSMIERASNILGMNVDDSKKFFLGVVHENEYTETFVDISLNYLMFRTKQTHNDSLLNMVDKYYGQKLEQDEPLPPIVYSNIAEEWHRIVFNYYLLSGGIDIDLETDLERKLIDSPLVQPTVIFGLRFDKDGKWIDKEFAHKILKYIFKERKLKYLDAALVLATFMLPEDFDIINQSIVQLSLSQQEITEHTDFLNFFARKATKYQKPFLFASNLSTFVDVTPRFKGFLNQTVESYQITNMKIIQSYLKSTLIKVASVLDKSTYNLFEFSAYQLIDTIEDIVGTFAANKKLWNRMWVNMSSENAPWDLNQLNKVTKHYKRDQFYSTFFCPFRTKINKHFDNHEVASMRRETGQKIEPPPPKPIDEDRHPLTIPDEIEEETATQDSAIPDKEKILVNQPIEIIKVTCVKEASFVMTSVEIRITYEKTMKVKTFKIADILYIFLRKRFQRPTGLELFCKQGRSILLSFLQVKNTTIAKKIAELNPPSIRYIQVTNPTPESNSAARFTAEWKAGRLSNFGYLMMLNMLAGRSFNDPSQYPIMPWVISDYWAEDGPKEFREMFKPIGSFGENRMRELKERIADFALFKETPFLYTAYISSPLLIFLYLIRLEPFTSLHIELQSGKFDATARLFISIPAAYASATSTINDVRELIPEFFYSPEFLTNPDNFDLGLNNQGQPVDNVELPVWASSPLDFIYKNRKMLEECETINEWIDIHFGCKTRGQAAIDADNTYKPTLYDDVWDNEPDPSPMKRMEIEASLENIGIIPPQLFAEEHPKRHPVKKPTLENQQLQLESTDITHAHVIATEKGINVISFSPPNLCTTTIFMFNNRIVTFQSKTIQHKAPNPSFIRFLHPNWSLMLSNQDVMVVNETSGDVKVLPRKRRKITSINTYNAWISLSDSDGRTDIYRPFKIGKPLCSVPSYRNSINCSCLSDVFGVYLIGVDEQVIENSLDDGQIIRVIDVGMKVIDVLITPTWGFIVISALKIEEGKTQNYLLLYTINGVFVKKTKIDCEIEMWTAFESDSGFDFLVYAASNGITYVLEIYDLDKDNKIKKLYHPIGVAVVGINYLKRWNSLVTVTTDGKVFLNSLLD